MKNKGRGKKKIKEGDQRW